MEKYYFIIAQCNIEWSIFMCLESAFSSVKEEISAISAWHVPINEESTSPATHGQRRQVTETRFFCNIRWIARDTPTKWRNSSFIRTSGFTSGAHDLRACLDAHTMTLYAKQCIFIVSLLWTRIICINLYHTYHLKPKYIHMKFYKTSFL